MSISLNMKLWVVTVNEADDKPSRSVSVFGNAYVSEEAAKNSVLGYLQEMIEIHNEDLEDPAEHQSIPTTYEDACEAFVDQFNQHVDIHSVDLNYEVK